MSAAPQRLGDFFFFLLPPTVVALIEQMFFSFLDIHATVAAPTSIVWAQRERSVLLQYV